MDVVKRVTNHTFVVPRSLSWREVNELAWRGLADYSIVTGGLQLNHLAWIWLMAQSEGRDPCEEIRRYLETDEEIYETFAFALENNCNELKKLLFGTERDWYQTLAIVPALARSYMVGNYSVWAIVHFENNTMTVDVYNVVDPEQRRAFLEKYMEIVRKHPRVIVLMGVLPLWWYDWYREIVKSGVPLVIVLGGRENVAVTPPLDSYLRPYSYYSIATALYVNGSLRAVVADHCERAGPTCIELSQSAIRELLELARG